MHRAVVRPSCSVSRPDGGKKIDFVETFAVKTECHAPHFYQRKGFNNHVQLINHFVRPLDMALITTQVQYR